jgi:methyl-accepting chemotaxis protein
MTVIDPSTGQTNTMDVALDVGGRQRMLNQRLMKAALLYVITGDSDSVDEGEQAGFLLQETITALLHGGKVSLSGGVRVDLNPIRSPDVIAALVAQEALIETLLEQVRAVQESKDDPGDTIAALLAAGDELQANADGVVKLLAAELSRQQESLRSHAGTLAHRAEELSASSTQLASIAAQTTAETKRVASSIDQLQSHIQEISSSYEELRTAMQEIGTNVEKTRTLSDDANTHSGRALERMLKLQDSGRSIHQVVGVIAGIASQTNLLALNATIEAARAGEAGKGFSIVANEVKELARATAKSTESVDDGVTTLHTDTEGALKAIRSIQGVSEAVAEASAAIASAVTEELAIADDVSRSLSQMVRETRSAAEILPSLAQGSETLNELAQSGSNSSTDVAGIASEVRHLIET